MRWRWVVSGSLLLALLFSTNLVMAIAWCWAICLIEGICRSVQKVVAEIQVIHAQIELVRMRQVEQLKQPPESSLN